jgi:hypothetical protein
MLSDKVREYMEICEDLNRKLAARDAHIAELQEALKPFAKIAPSTCFPSDGSEGEEYVVFLKTGHDSPAEFTGADLKRARDAFYKAAP